MVDAQLTRADLEVALSGDTSALAELVDRLTPVVQTRVARSLRRRDRLGSRSVRQEVEDLSQEVFVALFADDAKVLRSWDPARGLSLANFVGFVAERQVASILRTGKRNPWREDPTLTEELDGADPAPDPHHAATSRQILRRLLLRLEEVLSPLGRHLFELIYLQEKSVSEVERETGLGSDAVYAWRSRLRRLARRNLAELTSESERQERIPRQRSVSV